MRKYPFVSNQVSKESVMVGSDFRVNLIFWHFLRWLWTRFHIILYSYFVFWAGCFTLQNMHVIKLNFLKMFKMLKCSKLLPATLEKKRKLWLWSIWFQIVNSVSSFGHVASHYKTCSHQASFFENAQNA